ncbi:hypothetical protein AGENTSMITH_201 [Bacillus phage vB_BspM_AgentSmith]|nr:hypothetical protein AGENTSMITH_201 [Bacillus phage vB_BspM_AgentSmith]
MSILNPVISKFLLTEQVATQVYSCPAGKTHAILDVSFFKDNEDLDSLIAIAVTESSDPSSLSTVDYFIDDIELIGSVNFAELNKLVVGEGQKVYIKVLSGPDVSVRLAGVEENNPKVLKAGRLGAVAVPSVNQTQIFNNDTPASAYTAASLTVFNTDANDCIIEGWITNSTTPSAGDKFIKLAIPSHDTVIVEAMLLAPGERIFFKSDKVNTEYFIVGTVIGA